MSVAHEAVAGWSKLALGNGWSRLQLVGHNHSPWVIQQIDERRQRRNVKLWCHLLKFGELGECKRK